MSTAARQMFGECRRLARGPKGVQINTASRGDHFGLVYPDGACPEVHAREEDSPQVAVSLHTCQRCFIASLHQAACDMTQDSSFKFLEDVLSTLYCAWYRNCHSFLRKASSHIDGGFLRVPSCIIQRMKHSTLIVRTGISRQPMCSWRKGDS